MIRERPAADKWSRQQYLEYVERTMKDLAYVTRMLGNFAKELDPGQRGHITLSNATTANDRDLDEPDDPDEARIKDLKAEIRSIQRKRFKKFIKAKDGGLDTSESDSASDVPSESGGKRDFGFKKRIAAKDMPRPATPPPAPDATKAATTKTWRKKKQEEDTSEEEGSKTTASSAARPASASAKASASASAGQTAKTKVTNKAPPKREASAQAKDMFRDATAAKNGLKNLRTFNGSVIPVRNFLAQMTPIVDVMMQCFGATSVEVAIVSNAVMTARLADTIDDLYARARAGDKVGSKLMMQFLAESVQEFNVASEYSYVPENGRVPTMQEHYIDQQLIDMPAPIYRPRNMINATDFYPVTEDEQHQLLDIMRNALSSKSSHSSGYKRTAENAYESNMTILQLNLVTLNLGHINRQPIIAGAFKFDKHIRESEAVLPHLVFKNGGHIITLCEASDDRGGIEKHTALCQEHARLGVVVHSHADISAPALACFLRGSQEAGSDIELAQPREDQSVLVLHGLLDVETMEVPMYRTGVTGRDVFRLGLSEVRIAVFHMSSFGWRSGYQGSCERWVHVLTAAIAAQMDFITGDGNLFAQRNFKNDSHTDFQSCILVDLLERLLAEINQHRGGMNQISYNIWSSIQAGAYIRALSGDHNVNADCMILISLSYGKQSQVSLTRSDSHKAAADGVVGSAFSDEVMLTDSERPKYLSNLGLGLKDSDLAARSPWVVVSKLDCQRNLRTGPDESDQKRKDRRYGRQPDYWQYERGHYDRDEEEQDDHVSRLRSTTPSSGVLAIAARTQAFLGDETSWDYGIISYPFPQRASVKPLDLTGDSSGRLRRWSAMVCGSHPKGERRPGRSEECYNPLQSIPSGNYRRGYHIHTANTYRFPFPGTALRQARKASFEARPPPFP
eukprot:s1063_g7.t1